MELYKFRLSKANKKAEIDFLELENEKGIFTKAAENCSAGITFKKSGKKISVEKITTDNIFLVLSSTTPLPSPKRTLSAFSRELTRMDKKTHIFDAIIYNHALFYTELMEISKSPNASSEDITSPELLKAIIDLLYAPADNYNIIQKKKAISQIKEIMLPFIVQ